MSKEITSAHVMGKINIHTTKRIHRAMLNKTLLLSFIYLLGPMMTSPVNGASHKIKFVSELYQKGGSRNFHTNKPSSSFKALDLKTDTLTIGKGVCDGELLNIAKQCKKFPSTTVLHLEKNEKITAKGVVEVLQMNSHFKTLINAEESSAIFTRFSHMDWIKFFKKCKNLQFFDVLDYAMPKEVISEHGEKLLSVVLGDVFQSHGLSATPEVLHRLPNLKYLKVRDGYSYNDFKALVAFLQSATKLERFLLCDHSLGVESALRLAEAINQGNAIKTFKSYGVFNNETSLAFAHHLGINKKMKTLTFGKNDINDETKRKVSGLLRWKGIDVSSFNIHD